VTELDEQDDWLSQLSSLGPSSCLIHRSAWKGNSQKLAITEFSEVRFQRAKSYMDASSLSGHRETVSPSVLRGAGIHYMVRS
jgi:hypothetical protein